MWVAEGLLIPLEPEHRLRWWGVLEVLLDVIGALPGNSTLFVEPYASHPWSVLPLLMHRFQLHQLLPPSLVHSTTFVATTHLRTSMAQMMSGGVTLIH